MLFSARPLIGDISMLEAMLAVPPNELWMRPISLSLWHQYSAGGIDDRSDAVGIVRLPRNDDPHVVVQPDQTAIEHPMRDQSPSGKRQFALATDIRREFGKIYRVRRILADGTCGYVACCVVSDFHLLEGGSAGPLTPLVESKGGTRVTTCF